MCLCGKSDEPKCLHFPILSTMTTTLPAAVRTAAVLLASTPLTSPTHTTSLHLHPASLASRSSRVFASLQIREVCFFNAGELKPAVGWLCQAANKRKPASEPHQTGERASSARGALVSNYFLSLNTVPQFGEKLWYVSCVMWRW